MARQTASAPRRREPDHPDDVLVARTLAFSNWARQNTQVLIVLGIVLALLVGGLLYYLSFQRGLRQDAIVELERIQQTLAVGEAEAAKAELVTYLDRFGETPYAGEARLLLGQLYLESGQVPQAVDALQAASDDLGEPIGVQAAVLLAKAHEAQGALEEAEGLYLRVAEEATLDFQVTNALADAARLRTRQDDREGAAELYRRILEGMEPNDPERGVYEMRLQEVLTEANG